VREARRCRPFRELDVPEKRVDFESAFTLNDSV